jgi:hypothetical protein
MTLALTAFGALVAVAQGATPAWKVLAVTGPTNLPPKQSEVQQITVEAEGGSFTLAQVTATGTGTPVVNSGHLALTSGSTSATIVDGAFEVGVKISGTNLAVGTTVVSCTPDCVTAGSVLTLSAAATGTNANRKVSIFTKELAGVSVETGAFHVGDEISGTAFRSSLEPGTRITAVGPGTLTISQYPAETLGVKMNLTASESTAAIAYNASAAAMQSALEALPFVGPGGVSVSGGPGGDAAHPYTVAFGGSLAERNVSEFEAVGSGLGPHGSIHVSTVVPGGPGTGEIAIFPVNVGGAATNGVPVPTVEMGPLPEGIVVSGAAKGNGWTCTTAPDARSITCSDSTAPVSALKSASVIRLPVEVQNPTPLTSSVPVSVSGGGAATSGSYSMPVVVSAQPAEAGIQALWAGAFDEDGREFTQAGGHPYSAATDFLLNTIRLTNGTIAPAGEGKQGWDLKEVQIDLPPGFLGNPLVTSRCPQSLLAEIFSGPTPACNPSEMGVGELEPVAPLFGRGEHPFPIFNDVPVFGSLAEFTTRVVGPIQSLIGSVRSEGDFGVRISAPNVPTVDKLYGTYGVLQGRPTGGQGKAFLVYPTDCAQQRQEQAEGRGPLTAITVSSWQKPTAATRSTAPQPLLQGCQALTESWLGIGPEPKKPSLEFQPTDTTGSSGTGAVARLHIPQEGLSPAEKPGERERLATSALKKAVVTLPAGLTVNPSSANGLEACTEAQIGYRGSDFPSPNPIRFNDDPVRCPDGSKLGTVEATSPAAESPLQGTIYLAAQEENPFHSLLALYLVIDSPRFGVRVKLAGEVKLDPDSGQLTATFDNNPQLPVEDLNLTFRGGRRAELATPEVCGHYATTSALTPWSAEHGEAAQVSEPGFDVRRGCASSSSSRAFSPSFEAGTVDPKAGAYSPLVIKVNRNDGEQELTKLDFTLPLGVTAKLAGVPYCPDSAIATAAARAGKAETANPSCPSASQIGTVDTGAGVGGEPIHVGGKVYLAGPYKGAPLSAVVVSPAVAGPFDLGTVVIRTPLNVNLQTAQITAESDPIPTILKGIPLKIRSVAIKIDRSSFSLNPTNCEPMSVKATLSGSSGATTKPSKRFQVGGCKQLKFKPGLKISLKGATKRAGHPALKAVLTYPKKAGYANIARAQVGLPHSEFLDQGNLNKVCKQADLRAGTCPRSSIYGHAKAWTPLLEKPLAGPVYLGVGFGYKLPALVADLNGQIRILLVGRVDTTKRHGIRNTFEVVPDAPVSRFELRMKGGKKYGLLENSENICRKPQRASALFTAQNGLVDHLTPKIGNSCKKRQKKARHTSMRHSHGRSER